MLPVHQVRVHAVCQQREEHVRVREQIALAAREDGRHAQPGGQQPIEMIPSAVADDHRETGGDAQRLRWISRDAAQLRIVIDPACVVGVDRSTNATRSARTSAVAGCGNGIAGGIHGTVRISAMRQEELDHLALAGFGRCVQRPAFGGRWPAPVRICAAFEQQKRDLVMTRFEGGRKRSSSARSRLANSLGPSVKDPPDVFDLRQGPRPPSDRASRPARAVTG